MNKSKNPGVGHQNPEQAARTGGEEVSDPHPGSVSDGTHPEASDARRRGAPHGKATDVTLLTGSCLCGQVRITVRGPPDRVGICHCTDCRQESGSAFTRGLACWTVRAYRRNRQLFRAVLLPALRRARLLPRYTRSRGQARYSVRIAVTPHPQLRTVDQAP